LDKIEWNKVIYKDCLNEINGLPTLPDKCVDICVYDPPYNAKKDYGVYKDNLSLIDYISFMKKVIYECNRISKRGIGIYIDSWRFKMFWQKIFQDSTPIILKKRCHTFSNKINLLTKYHVILTNIIALKSEWDVWDVTVITDGYICKEKRYDHPSQTGSEPIIKFLETFTKKNDIVCDPFIGSGTIPFCCKKMNRRWIGYETNETYSQDINKRLKQINRTRSGVLGWIK